MPCIQQFDAAFEGENFIESSKLGHVAMYLGKIGCHWWESMKAQGLAIMKQFLDNNTKDDMLLAWQSLTLGIEWGLWGPFNLDV